ncbi:hypothetical protein P4S91_04630 [Aneurinibacillus aneurinilyticus]|uniref:hypothetical protein n=1 Tax=Aneurinibacillus aneurinilyticus TaxID=1391 RepID=UPI002E1E2C54|nr:hypothetical protein [Aneurinibacillus aneurinilyticus]MED0722217.1 hypothetical protein [Aneurinibacillus aneurinilyticus]
MAQKMRTVVAGDKEITLNVNRYPIQAEKNISNSDEFYSISIFTRVNGEIFEPGFLERAIGGEALYRELIFDKSKDGIQLREADEFEKDEWNESNRLYSYGMLLSGFGLGIDGLSKTEKMEELLLNELEAFLLKHVEKIASEPYRVSIDTSSKKRSSENIVLKKYNPDEITAFCKEHVVKITLQQGTFKGEIITTLGGNEQGASVLGSVIDSLANGWLSIPKDHPVNQKHAKFEQTDTTYATVETFVLYAENGAELFLSSEGAADWVVGVEIIDYYKEEIEG